MTRRELDLLVWGVLFGLMAWPVAAVIVAIIFQFTGGGFCPSAA